MCFRSVWRWSTVTSRFLTMNQAFREPRVEGLRSSVYPGDLVVKEDKAAVADAVRRNARGPGHVRRHCGSARAIRRSPWR